MRLDVHTENNVHDHLLDGSATRDVHVKLEEFSGAIVSGSGATFHETARMMMRVMWSQIKHRVVWEVAHQVLARPILHGACNTLSWSHVCAF